MHDLLNSNALRDRRGKADNTTIATRRKRTTSANNYPHVPYQKALPLTLRADPPRNVTVSTKNRSEDAALFARVDGDQQQDRRCPRKKSGRRMGIIEFHAKILSRCG